MDESETVPPDLFKGLKFYLLDDGDVADKVKSMLLSGGGTLNSYLSDMVTHVICDNPDNSEVTEAQELFEKPVVTSRWVFISVKCKKLLPLTGFSAGKNQLFHALKFSASQISVDDKKKLWAMITYFGGEFSLNFTKDCTHLVVGKPEGNKYEKALASGKKIVTPDWVSDSVRNRYLCDEDLYHPRLLILPEPEVPPVPSPGSPSLTSAMISLDKINIDPSISAGDQAFLQNLKIDNKIADDILGSLPTVENIKTEPSPQYGEMQQAFAIAGNRMGLTASQQGQLGGVRPTLNIYQQTLQHQQMLQQGEQKLNQALQQIQAAQQQQQQRPQLQQQQQQQPQKWPQQRMTFAQQQHLQQQLLQMQRLRALQQQQALRNRGLQPAQYVQQQLQLQQLQQQQQNIQQPNQQQQVHLQQRQQQPAALPKPGQQQIQLPIQQTITQQGQQALLQSQLLQQQGQTSGGSTPNPQQLQQHLQLQAHLRQQQQQQQQQQPNLTQLQLQQQQALQKHQLQQLLKQQQLQQLQQQQQQQAQQQRALTQSPNMPPSPLHIQQQNILQQASPRQSPLQQQSPQLQHSPQSQGPQTPGGVLQQPQQQQRPQTPLMSGGIPLSPLQQQQMVLEKVAAAQQQTAVDKQQTELIKVQLKQAALERAHLQARLQQQQQQQQQQLEKGDKPQVPGFDNPHLQQQALHPQLQRSAAHQLQLQQQIHQLQLQKAAAAAGLQSQKIELTSNVQPQFAVQQSVSKPSGQLQQQQAVHRLQLQQLSVQQLQQRLQQQGLQQKLHQQQLLQQQQGGIIQQQGTIVQQQSGIVQQGIVQQQQSLVQQGSPAQQLQQLRMQQQQGSPAPSQLQQGSPLAQGSPAQLPQGSPAHQSPSAALQLQQGSPVQPQQHQLQGSPQVPAQAQIQLQAQMSPQVMSDHQPSQSPQLDGKLKEAPSPLSQLPPTPTQLQSPDLQQQLHLQLSQQQQAAEQNPPTTPSPLRQPSPSIQMQLSSQQAAQLQQKIQLQQQQRVQLQQQSAAQQQVLQLKQVQGGNQQQIQLPQASVQQVHLHVLQQARLQALRQQQAQLQQSITQQQGNSNSSQLQQQLGSGQAVRQTLPSPQSIQQGSQPQTSPQRLQSPIPQAQLQQQLSQLQQAQLQQKAAAAGGLPQTLLQQNQQQLQTQLQQIQLRHTTLQQAARLQQPAAATQGHIPRPQQPPPPQVQAQIVAKQIQLQQQQQPQQQQQQVQQRFPHQLSPALRAAVQKQFPMHGQPPVQNLHPNQQQQLLQQQRQLQQQQQLALLRQRQLQQQLQQQQQQQQQGQTPVVQPPVMMKPPPQYPFDRQQSQQQLQGQPRLQYSPQQRPWQPGAAGAQQQFLRRSPGASTAPQQWQPKEEPNQQVVWAQRPAELRGETPPTQVVWQQQQQGQPQQPPTPSPQQSLQWQQLELQRRQQAAQQPQQRPPQPQFSPTDAAGGPRATPTSPLAVPAQYQPQNAPSILATGQPGAAAGVVAAQVTPKTKTALANLLNTRLQTTGRVNEGDMVGQQQVVRTGQIIGQPATQNVARRASADGGVMHVQQAQLPPERVLVPPVVPQQIVFYGHDPKINVPSDLCLLGCVFAIEDYDKSSEYDIESWTKVIMKHGGDVESSYNSRCTHVICENQRNPVVQQALREGKRCVTAFWLNDVLEKKKLRHPWLALHLPTPFSDEKPCKNQIICITNFEAEERTILKNIISILGAKYTGYMTSHNTIIICKKNEGRKVKKAREWRIPVVNVQWLHDLMFGHIDALRLSMAHKYQQYDMDNPFDIDYALVPHLMAAWKVPIKISEEVLKKNEIQENKSPENAANPEKNSKKRENEDGIEPEAKRARVESPPLEENIPLTTQTPPDNENKPRVLFTGISNMKDLAKIVLQLGGCLAKSETECTHLVANQYARTVKFLCAVHSAKFIVTAEWITECEKHNKFVDEMPFILRDLENEKLFGYNMENVINRTNRTPIFKDYVIFVTAGVFPKSETLKRIIEAGGGQPVFKKAPTLRQIKALEQNDKKFAIITCDNDLHLCKMYLEKNINVQNLEFILTNSIRQELDFTSFAYKP